MAVMTGRFTSSPESKMEFDLARLRDISDADGFINILANACDVVLTDDYWRITLPNDLATSSSKVLHYLLTMLRSYCLMCRFCIRI